MQPFRSLILRTLRRVSDDYPQVSRRAGCIDFVRAEENRAMIGGKSSNFIPVVSCSVGAYKQQCWSMELQGEEGGPHPGLNRCVGAGTIELSLSTHRTRRDLLPI